MQDNKAETDRHWRVFYKLAGISALLIVLVGILDILISTLAGEAKSNTLISVIEWFDLFESNRIVALSNLGLINIITLTLGLPIYLALINSLYRSNPPFSLLSGLFFFIGAAVYFSSNTIFSMLALSSQYISAPENQKPLLEAAGRAVLAQGADLTPGTYLGLLFTQIAGVMVTITMMKSTIFSKWISWFGLFGYSCMVVFFSISAFTPSSFYTAMMISMFGGLSLMVYHILLARRLLKLSH